MAVSITKDLTLLWDGETIGTWTGLTPAQYDGFNREGTYCLGDAASNTTITGYQTFTAFSMTGKAVYIWMFCAGNMDTIANGGMGIVLGDGTNRRAYYIGGSDSTKFQVGVWGCYMVDASNPPAQYTQELGTGAPDWGNITQVGVRFKTLSKALGGADNCFWDVARYGKGLIVKGGGVGTEGTFAQIAADDKSKAAEKAYGIVREMQAGVFEVQGSLTFGDDTGTESTYFKDQDTVVVFANNGAGSAFYQLKVVGNNTGTNSFILGKKVGTGDTALGSNGCLIQSAGPGLKVDLSPSSANVNTLNIYGSKFYKASNGLLGSTNTAHEFIGNTIDQCGQADPKQMIVRNCTFSGYTPDTNGAMLWNASINIKKCSFNANADPTNDPHGIEHPAQGSFTYYDLTVTGNDYDIYYTAPASSGVLTITKDGTSNPSTYEILNPTGNSVSIIGSVPVTITVVDKDNVGIFEAQTAIYNADNGTVVMNMDTNASGVASTSYTAGTPQDVYIRVRKSSAGATKYISASTTGTIATTTGLSVKITLQEDTNA